MVENKKTVTVVGGGTGLSVLLRGLKHYDVDINAVVTVSDNGGSSGKLREELGILPPGDIRNCISALAEDEGVMGRVLSHRFAGAGGLEGHSLGNLILAGLTEMCGDMETASSFLSSFLAVKGRVIPVTAEDVNLRAIMKDGSSVFGESQISKSPVPVDRIELVPGLSEASEAAVEAVEKADLLVFGPGSLYTSIIPNLMVGGILDAVRRNRGKKVYISNVMTQQGETKNFTAADHVKALFRHGLEGLLDVVIANNSSVSRDITDAYRAEGAEPVVFDGEKITEMGLEARGLDLLDSRKVVRHNPELLAAAVAQCLEGC